LISSKQLAIKYGEIPSDIRTEGRHWYENARVDVRDLARDYGVDAYKVAAVMAALSPQTRWWVNVRSTREMLEAMYLNREMPRTGSLYYANVIKAWDILIGNRPVESFRLGTKTHEFWQNLAGNEYAVTIDTWMLRVLECDAKSLSPKQYLRAKDCIARTAGFMAEVPAQFQAMLWIHTRGKAE